mgnify:CR=1 FL=1
MSEIAKFLIKNNLINETYTNYLVRQSPNGLREEEKKFLVSVLLKDSEELKKIKEPRENIAEISKDDIKNNIKIMKEIINFFKKKIW